MGQKIKAEIISIENSKIFLSMKKLSNDPWEGIEKKYKVGQKIEGTVIKINPFGLFVELEKNIQGLAHISQLTEKQAANLNELAKVGEIKEFYIVSIDSKNHRLGLSLTKPKNEEKEVKQETGKTIEKPTETEQVIEAETTKEKEENKKTEKKKKETTKKQKKETKNKT